MIVITGIFEEQELASDEPGQEWFTEPEDERQFTAASFGIRGDAWATVFSVHMEYRNRFFSALFNREPSRVPVSESLELRVCSPSFIERDPRFLLADGRHRALVQEEFSRTAVEEYCRQRVGRAVQLRGPKLIAAWEEDFYIFDPDED